MTSTLTLPFDQYQRYRLVADLLEEVRPRKGAVWEILDVGGRTALLRNFLPRDRVTLVDLEISAEPGLVLGDGSRLPFADGAFDVVCAFDTLEHVPPARRAAFVSECRRVARRYVAIAGPYDAPKVAEAEKLLQRFLKDKLAVEHRYLDEHRHHGLPVRSAVEQQLEKIGAKVGSVGHGSLERWLPLMCLSMYMDYVPELRGLATEFHRYYNRELYESDSAEPVYRHVVVGALAGAPLPTGKALAPKSPASRDALPKIADLAYDVVAFDLARAKWKKERARLEEIVADLKADLAGHQKSLGEITDLRTAQDKVLATLRQDLDGHKATLVEIRALRKEQDEVLTRLGKDLDSHRASLTEVTSRRAELAAVVAAMEKDLAGHKKTLTEVRTQADAVAKELATTRDLRAKENAAFQTVRAELERLLGEHKAVIATRDQDLAGHKKALAAAGAELKSARAELAEVRTELARTQTARTAEVAALQGVVATLQRDLEEHRKVVAELGRDLAGHRELVATLRGESEGLRRELETALDERNNARLAVEEAHARIADREQALRERDALIEALRVELRNRWRSLRRALGPKRPTPGE